MPKTDRVPYVEVELDVKRRQKKVSIVMPSDWPDCPFPLVNPQVLEALNTADQNISREFVKAVAESVFPTPEQEPPTLTQQEKEGKPTCFNRPDYLPTVDVVDGVEEVELQLADGSTRMTEIPHLITIPNNNSKGCMQWKAMGEAYQKGWDCGGCKHYPTALEIAKQEQDP